MRDPERSDRILSLIEAIWELYPDLRLGQVLVNACGQAFEANSFYCDDALVEAGLLDYFTNSLPVEALDGFR